MVRRDADIGELLKKGGSLRIAAPYREDYSDLASCIGLLKVIPDADPPLALRNTKLLIIGDHHGLIERHGGVVLDFAAYLSSTPEKEIELHMRATDPLARSRNMAAIRGKDTRPELAVRRFLHGKGLRYQLHAASLPGKPDLVFRSRRTVVFVHGCFWITIPGDAQYEEFIGCRPTPILGVPGGRARSARGGAT